MDVNDFSEFAADADIPQYTDRELGMALLRGQIRGSQRRSGSIEGIDNTLNYDRQLDAIRVHLEMQRSKKTEPLVRIDVLERRGALEGGLSEAALGDRGTEIELSIYGAAVFSLASVAMLAPLVESVFRRAFRELEQQHQVLRKPPPTHPRWARNKPNHHWDCEQFSTNGTDWEGRGDIARGILELSEASGLRQYVPAELELLVPALLCYRNQTFHHGLEWPFDVLRKFEDRRAREGWPSRWFAGGKLGRSSQGPGQPALHDIYFVTDDFVAHCLSTVDAVVEGLGKYARVHLR
jgi:hypothetical protein